MKELALKSTLVSSTHTFLHRAYKETWSDRRDVRPLAPPPRSKVCTYTPVISRPLLRVKTKWSYGIALEPRHPS